MIKHLTYFQIFALLMTMAMISACASHPLRVREDDPTLRVAVYMGDLTVSEYTRLEDSLFRSNKFILVDRGEGHSAVKDEQDEQHTGKDAKRYSKEERYARMGKMYGVGSLIVASESCSQYQTFWGNPYWNCFQNLSLVNVTTGEVVAMGTSESASKTEQESPAWDEAVEHMNNTIPKRMIASDNPNLMTNYGENLGKYRDDVSKDEDSIGQKPVSQDPKTSPEGN